MKKSFFLKLKWYHKSYIFILMLLISFFITRPSVIWADDITPTVTPTPSSSSTEQVKKLQDQISEYQSKISGLQGQEKTLSSAISLIDINTKKTELRILNTEKQIEDLEADIEVTKKRIGGLESNITNSTKAMLGRVSGVYQVGNIQPWQVLLSSGNISNFLTRLKYLKIVQIYDKKTIYAAEQSKVNYANEKSILEDKQKEEEDLRKQLEGYTAQLEQEKAAKKTLLTQTQGDEANYQKLLSQAKAQLAGFSNFTQNQGGASLLSGQTSCDDWGCYYNQRDSQWGSNALNGTQYTLASDGCLVTAMAMVYTHYGHKNVTPQTINSNSSNFASYYPAYLLYAITADGASSQRVGAAIDSTLASGHPVVVGVRAYGGTHFVVLISGSGGNYLMHDPYVSNGHKIPFTDHYTVGSIYEVNRVAF